MKKILIIDDDPNNILALSAILVSRQWQVVKARSVEEGWQALRKDSGIGIILLDMMMPETDGYEMLNQLRNDNTYRHLPVIAVTAQAMLGDREKCLEAGANEYISKPINVDRLFLLLDQFIK